MDIQEEIKELIKNHDVILFMKGTEKLPMCGFSQKSLQILKKCSINPYTINVLENQEIRQGIKQYSNWPTIPQLYVKGEFLGGSDILEAMYENGELEKILKSKLNN